MHYSTIYLINKISSRNGFFLSKDHTFYVNDKKKKREKEKNSDLLFYWITLHKPTEGHEKIT